MSSEKRTDLHEGDEVVIHIRGTLEEIVDHGTRDNPKWWAHVQTRSGGDIVKQEDVTPYIEIPEALRYCPECGRERVWDDPRKAMPYLVCPRCVYEDLRRMQKYLVQPVLGCEIRGFPGIKGNRPTYPDGEKLVPLDDLRRCEVCVWFSATGADCDGSGDCTRFPAWVSVPDPVEHQCGEFLADPILLHDLMHHENKIS